MSAIPPTWDSIPVALLLADLDGDGEVDAAVQHTSGAVAVLPGDGQGAFAPASNFYSSPHFQYPMLQAADLDGDADLDLVATGRGFVVMPNPRTP